MALRHSLTSLSFRVESGMHRAPRTKRVQAAAENISLEISEAAL